MTGPSAAADIGGRHVGDNMELAAAFEQVLRSGDFRQISQVMRELSTDDFVQEWPQSGERLGKEAAIKVDEGYAEMSGTTPTFSYKRMLGGGDTFVVEGTIDYGDGVPVSYVGIGEARDGKIAKMTEYFANPFEAPAWRKPFVEMMEPVKV
jgi:SnoaL-like protein